MSKSNGKGTVKFITPLAHRPGVVVAVHSDGRRRIAFSDGELFSSAELYSCLGPQPGRLAPVKEPPSSTSKFLAQLTSDEQHDLDEAQARLTEALVLVDKAAEEMWRRWDVARAFESGRGSSWSNREAAEQKRLADLHSTAKLQWEAARDVEAAARRELSTTEQRLYIAVQERELAATTPPPPRLESQRPLGERLRAMTKRLGNGK